MAMTNFRAEDMPGNPANKSEATKTPDETPKSAPKKAAPRKAPAKKSEPETTPVAEDPKKADTSATSKENTNE